MKTQVHRVKRGPAYMPPPLPKEATPIAPREYVDRYGTQLTVTWNGQAGDPPLTDMGRGA